MAHPLFAFFLVIGLSPESGFAEAIGPEVNGVSQELITGPAHLSLADLARLVTDRRGAGKALEYLMGAVALRIVTDGRQQPRP